MEAATAKDTTTKLQSETELQPSIAGHSNFYHMSPALPGLWGVVSLCSGLHLPIQFHVFHLPVHYNSRTDSSILINRISQGEDLQLPRHSLANFLWEPRGLQSSLPVDICFRTSAIGCPSLESNSCSQFFSWALAAEKSLDPGWVAFHSRLPGSAG